MNPFKCYLLNKYNVMGASDGPSVNPLDCVLLNKDGNGALKYNVLEQITIKRPWDTLQTIGIYNHQFFIRF